MRSTAAVLLGLVAATALACTGGGSDVASVPGPGAVVDPSRLVQPLAPIRVFAGRGGAPVVTGFIADTPIVLVDGTWREAAAPIQASAFTVDSAGWVFGATAEPQAGGASSALQIRRWTGSSWEPYGPVVPSTPPSGRLVVFLEIDLSSRPAVAWERPSWPVLAGLARWTGTAWSTHSIDLSRPEELFAFAVGRDLATWSWGWAGGVSAVDSRTLSGDSKIFAGYGTNEPLPVALAVSADDVPAVARTGSMNALGPVGPRLAVERWSGTALVQLGDDLAPAGAPGEVALAAGSRGALACAWSDGGHVEVRRWTGAAWEPVGGPRSHRAPALAFDASGALLVAWLEQVGTSGDVALYAPRVDRIAP